MNPFDIPSIDQLRKSAQADPLAFLTEEDENGLTGIQHALMQLPSSDGLWKCPAFHLTNAKNNHLWGWALKQSNAKLWTKLAQLDIPITSEQLSYFVEQWFTHEAASKTLSGTFQKLLDSMTPQERTPSGLYTVEVLIGLKQKESIAAWAEKDPSLWEWLKPSIQDTLLHCAARAGWREGILFLQQQAQYNPLQTNSLGDTPMELAKNAGVKIWPTLRTSSNAQDTDAPKVAKKPRPSTGSDQQMGLF